jgi:3,4-dihydroxy-2-butanone 4-phosphate synthase
MVRKNTSCVLNICGGISRKKLKWTPKQVRETRSEFKENFSRPGHVQEFYAWNQDIA